MRIRQTNVISEATIRLEDMSQSYVDVEEIQQELKSSKILIVDDESFNIRAINVLISSYGLNPDKICDKAKNGAVALKMVKENAFLHKYRMIDYDLILMDGNMPVMDGYEAAK